MYALKVLGVPWSCWNVPRCDLQAYLGRSHAVCFPCWWGAISAFDRTRLQDTLNRAARWRLCVWPPHSLIDLCEAADWRDCGLFSDILSDPSNLFRPILPPPKPHTLNLRKRSHSLVLQSSRVSSLNSILFDAFLPSFLPVNIFLFYKYVHLY